MEVWADSQLHGITYDCMLKFKLLFAATVNNSITGLIPNHSPSALILEMKLVYYHIRNHGLELTYCEARRAGLFM